jgi:hypothetical protein
VPGQSGDAVLELRVFFNSGPLSGEVVGRQPLLLKKDAGK